MTTIKATCPGCGEVEMTSADVILMVCSQPSLTYYTFTCPACEAAVRKPADDHIATLLMSGGVSTSVWEVPAEALEDHDGPVLTYDDVLDFVLMLGTTDLLAAAAQRPTMAA